jgi:hypothetical protein
MQEADEDRRQLVINDEDAKKAMEQMRSKHESELRQERQRAAHAQKIAEDARLRVAQLSSVCACVAACVASNSIAHSTFASAAAKAAAAFSCALDHGEAGPCCVPIDSRPQNSDLKPQTRKAGAIAAALAVAMRLLTPRARRVSVFASQHKDNECLHACTQHKHQCVRALRSIVWPRITSSMLVFFADVQLNELVFDVRTPTRC